MHGIVHRTSHFGLLGRIYFKADCLYGIPNSLHTKKYHFIPVTSSLCTSSQKLLHTTTLHTTALHTKCTSYQATSYQVHFILSHFIPNGTSYQVHFIPNSLHTKSLHTKCTSYQVTSYLVHFIPSALHIKYFIPSDEVYGRDRKICGPFEIMSHKGDFKYTV